MPNMLATVGRIRFCRPEPNNQSPGLFQMPVTILFDTCVGVPELPEHVADLTAQFLLD
jgi:hypothetical protein